MPASLIASRVRTRWPAGSTRAGAGPRIQIARSGTRGTGKREWGKGNGEKGMGKRERGTRVRSRQACQSVRAEQGEQWTKRGRSPVAAALAILLARAPGATPGLAEGPGCSHQKLRSSNGEAESRHQLPTSSRLLPNRSRRRRRAASGAAGRLEAGRLEAAAVADSSSSSSTRC